MTINVSKDAEHAINALIQGGQFASAEDMVDRLVKEYAQRCRQQAQPMPSTAGHQAAAPAHKPIWERILERTAAIPDEEWEKLPVDGAEQHDHYIYGTPKRQTQ